MQTSKVNRVKYVLLTYLFIFASIILVSPVFAQTTVTIESLNSSLFHFIYSNVSVKYNGSPVLDLTKNEFQVFENSALQTKYFDIIPPATSGGVRLADIVFLIDVSGSMGPEIADVRANVKAFANDLNASNIDFQLGLVRFGNLSGANPYIFNNGNLTDDVPLFQSFVDTLVASGGYEPGFLAVRQAITGLNYRPGTQKIFIIITDEDSDDRNKQESINLLLTNSVTLHAAVDCSFGTSRSDYCDDTSIRGVTGGLLFGVRDSYSSILDTIVETASKTYIVRYMSSNPIFDGTLRTVEIFATAFGETGSDMATYTPGASPRINLTDDTNALFRNPPSEGLPLTISAIITDDVAPGVASARLFYKAREDTYFQSVSMVNIYSNIWNSSIPGPSVQYPGIEFYIVASDGQTTATLPQTNPSTQPLNLAILPNELPVISHTPPQIAIIGQPIEIVANISDTTHQIASIALRYRKKGEINFEEISLSVGTQTFELRQVIPADLVTINGIEYYIEVTDDLGLHNTYGKPDKPIFIPAGNLISTDFTFGRDNYSFINNRDFVDVALNKALETKLEELIGPLVSGLVLDILWGQIAGSGGLCWGMAETSAMYYIDPYIKPIPGKMVYEYTTIEASQEIYDYHAGQIYPILGSFVSLLWEQLLGTGNQKNDYDVIKSGILDNKPVVLSLFSDSGGHAVVSYKIIETDDYYYVYVYDPNYLNADERYVAFIISDANTYVVSPYFINDKIPAYKIHAFKPWLSATSITPVLKRQLSDLINHIVKSLYDNVKGYFRLSCPADALLVDQFGRRIGVVNGNVINEIPSASILSEGEIEIYEIPSDLSYEVKIVGTEPGVGDVNIVFPVLGSRQMKSVRFDNIPLSDGSGIVFSFSASGVDNLNIDQDGDGVFDGTQPHSFLEDFNIDFTDDDNDNIIDMIDNCPNDSNEDQYDSNYDGIGDACGNQPPISNAGVDQLIECTNPTGAPATLDGSTSYDPDGDPITYSWTGPFGAVSGINPFVDLPLGHSTITLVVNDGQVNSEPDTCINTVRDTTPPNLQISEDIIDECTSSNGQVVDFGSATATDICSNNITVANNASTSFTLGMTSVIWTAVDESGNSTQGVQLVNIVDTTPPEISIICTPDVIWPPDHRMIEVIPTIKASDICDSSVYSKLYQITMNEGAETNTYDPNYDQTTGDGHTVNDIQVTSDGRIYLRAERGGNNPSGRRYVITYRATDDSGNSASASCEVLVPHDMR